MTTYTFETMTQTQADAFVTNDVLVFSSTTTSGRSVEVSLTASTPVAVSKLTFAVGTKSLIFAQNAFVDDTSIVMADGSKLVVNSLD